MNRIQILETQLSKVAGLSIEITVISKKSFSFLWEGYNELVFKKIKNYFKGQAIEIYNDGPIYDEECKCCCIYAELK